MPKAALLTCSQQLHDPAAQGTWCSYCSCSLKIALITHPVSLAEQGLISLISRSLAVKATDLGGSGNDAHETIGHSSDGMRALRRHGIHKLQKPAAA